MDDMIRNAARSLALGEPLEALNQIALRNDPSAIAIRGTATARLGDLDRAKTLLRNAARAFGRTDPVAQARCMVAEAEVALVSRDLSRPTERLTTARETLEAAGDRTNAAHARHLELRHLLLTGQLTEAERGLAALDPSPFGPASRAAHELVVAGIAMRRFRTETAQEALTRAAQAARRAAIPTLVEEVEQATRLLNQPAARLIERGSERPVPLKEVEAILSSGAFVVDGCRHVARAGDTTVSLATRPVEFELLRALAEAWPEDVPNGTLQAQALGAKLADASHRERLQLEVARLREQLDPLGDVSATERGFTLVPHRGRETVVLAWPVDEEHASVLALLADGDSRSSSDLALALGVSQRTVQRALASLADDGKVEAVGDGRARRWMTPPPAGFTTTLLLPPPLPGDTGVSG